MGADKRRSANGSADPRLTNGSPAELKNQQKSVEQRMSSGLSARSKTQSARKSGGGGPYISLEDNHQHHHQQNGERTVDSKRSPEEVLVIFNNEINSNSYRPSVLSFFQLDLIRADQYPIKITDLIIIQLIIIMIIIR